MNSTRSTEFITPKSDVSRLFRDAVLELSEHHVLLVNSGRLSLHPPTLQVTFGADVKHFRPYHVQVHLAQMPPWMMGVFFCRFFQKALVF